MKSRALDLSYTPDIVLHFGVLNFAFTEVELLFIDTTAVVLSVTEVLFWLLDTLIAEFCGVDFNLVANTYTY